MCGEFPLCSTCVCESRVFSATAWFLSHISRMERQSYCTMESCLHGAAASTLGLFIRSASYETRRIVYGTVPCEEWFSLDSSAITPGCDGVVKTPIFRTRQRRHQRFISDSVAAWCVFWGMKPISLSMRMEVYCACVPIKFNYNIFDWWPWKKQQDNRLIQLRYFQTSVLWVGNIHARQYPSKQYRVSHKLSEA